MEEDIEILKECVEYETFGRSCKNRRNKLDNKCFTALENILNELERLKTENLNITREILSRTNVLNELLKENEILNEKIAEIRDKAECEDYYGLCDVIDDLNKLLGVE